MTIEIEGEGADEASGERTFRLPSGSVVTLGWLGSDLPFLIRSLRFLLRPQGEMLRRPFALEPGDIGVLGVVVHNPDISQNDLANSLVLKKSAVTKVVQGLERRGLVARRRNRSDRRSNALRPTAEGERLIERVHARADAMHDDWFCGISPQERQIFFSVLFRLVATLAAKQPKPKDADFDTR